jgi:23S rRNA (cytosine1962-C5)-methyltransferase
MNLFENAFSKREKNFNDTNSNCFRLFNSNADGLSGLTIDYYAGYLLVQFYDSSLVNSQTGILNEDLANQIINASKVLSCRGILCKDRIMYSSDVDFSQKRKSYIIFGDAPPLNHIVIQNKIKCLVDIIEGQSTGIFLDMRETRSFLENIYSAHNIEKMLNLFSYTGMFSAHALKNGVKYCTNVDLSQSVLNRAKKNYEINDLVIDNRDFIYGDSLDWSKRFAKRKLHFDFVIADPPTFSRHKNSVFSIKKDYKRLTDTISHIAEGGYALTAVNSQTVDKDEFLNYHPNKWELVYFAQESSDFFPEKESYLKTAFWELP